MYYSLRMITDGLGRSKRQDEAKYKKGNSQEQWAQLYYIFRLLLLKTRYNHYDNVRKKCCKFHVFLPSPVNLFIYFHIPKIWTHRRVKLLQAHVAVRITQTSAEKSFATFTCSQQGIKTTLRFAPKFANLLHKNLNSS